MHKLYLLLLTAFTAGCAADTGTSETLDELRAIRQEVASLSDSISNLKDSLKTLQAKPLKDTLAVVATKETKPVKTTTTTPTEKPQPAPKPPAAPPKENADTIYHKYVNGKVSVKITPWVNGERRVLFYDLYGNETFSLEEVRHSYTISVDLKFAPNGSVSMAKVHNNPGASMYWYESEITFDTTNGPISKIDHKYPQQSLTDVMNEKWVYWDKKSKSWKTQEVME